MPNTLTVLAPTLFQAAQEVSAEPFGAIAAINANFGDKGVAIGDKVSVPVAPTRAGKNYTPSMNPNNGSAGDDAVAAAVDVTITKNRFVDFHLTGEQERSLQNGGTDREWLRQLIAQGMRTLRNEAEADAVNAIKEGASRAVGAAGTNPFATNLDALVDARALLRSNGAPMTDAQVILNPASVVALQKLSIYQQASLAGSDEERRSGVMMRQFGFALRDSAQAGTHTKGTGSAYVTSGASALGVTDIALVTGTGTVLAGDVVTFAADSGNKYIINTGVAAPGTIKLGRPGVRFATGIPTANAMTIGNNYSVNLAFERQSTVGVMRPPLIPSSPLIDQRPISDGKGMTYLLARVIGDGMVTWRLHLAWGFKAVQSEHICVILG